VQKGRRVAFDVGAARIGVATCDPDAILASPQPFIERNDDDLQACLRLVEEIGAVAIYVGLPINLEGKWTPSTFDALYFAQDLEELTTTRVRLIDERLSTRTAQAQMREAGRNVKNSRKDIDSASAVEILERAIEILKAGRDAGLTTEQAEQRSH
jgi:putative Holliday junction resolvase